MAKKMAFEQVARCCRGPGETHIIGLSGYAFVPVACPAATDFPAGAVGHKTEGEKIGQRRSLLTPEDNVKLLSYEHYSHM